MRYHARSLYRAHLGLHDGHTGNLETPVRSFAEISRATWPVARVRSSAMAEFTSLALRVFKEIRYIHYISLYHIS